MLISSIVFGVSTLLFLSIGQHHLQVCCASVSDNQLVNKDIITDKQKERKHYENKVSLLEHNQWTYSGPLFRMAKWSWLDYRTDDNENDPPIAVQQSPDQNVMPLRNGFQSIIRSKLMVTVLWIGTVALVFLELAILVMCCKRLIIRRLNQERPQVE